LLYNPGAWYGKVRVSTWVSEFEDRDIPDLEGSWQPTGTSHINSLLRAEAERESQARDAAILA